MNRLSLFRPDRPTARDDASRRKAARRLRPAVDALEARTVLSTSTVTLVVTDPLDNPNSVDPHSLRGAIQQADAEPYGTDVVIDFDIYGGGLAIIDPVAPLPTITHTVTIDGTSQPGAGGTAEVILDGGALSTPSDGLDFTDGASGSVVEGLGVTRFGSAGLRFTAASNIQLVDDVVGLWAFGSTGTEYIEPNLYGVEFDGGAHETINDDVFSGNTNDGLRLIGTAFSLVESSKFGTDPSGSTYRIDSAGNPLGNGAADQYGTGLYLDNAYDNTVTGNVISNNGTYGLQIRGPQAYGNSITANEIGTDATGYVADPNMTGLIIAGGASDNIISGGNVISGNSWDGVDIDGQGTDENELIGNFIGTGTGGNLRVANWNGIQIVNNSAYSFVYDNTISGNDSDGVYLAQTQYNDIQQNQIGLGIYGTPDGNGIYGVILVEGASYNTVYGNNIQYNGGAGLVTSGAGWGNGFYYNTVVNNGDGNFIWG
jgi:titin